MKVKELIHRLELLDPEADVIATIGPWHNLKGKAMRMLYAKEQLEDDYVDVLNILEINEVSIFDYKGPSLEDNAYSVVLETYCDGSSLNEKDFLTKMKEDITEIINGM